MHRTAENTMVHDFRCLIIKQTYTVKSTICYLSIMFIQHKSECDQFTLKDELNSPSDCTPGLCVCVCVCERVSVCHVCTMCITGVGSMYVCVCVCQSEREMSERQGERKKSPLEARPTTLVSNHTVCWPTLTAETPQ